MRPPATPDRKAQWLLRTYPPSWRERYGEEFAELLVADLSERPRGTRRTLNVVASGLRARLSGLGLTGPMLPATEQARSSLAALICALAAFLVLGTSIWSQLTIGWQWSPPEATGTSVAVVVMSLGVVCFAALAVAAALPVVWSTLAAVRQRRAAGLGRPALLLAIGLVVVVVGGRHFGNGWPGTGGHPWSQQGLVPGGVAAFTWAATLSITTYWVHPHALLAFPGPELVWMLASPLALIMVVAGSAKIVRRVDLSPGLLRFEVRLGRVAGLAMVIFLGAAGLWMVEGESGAGPRNLFHTGVIDRIALVAMCTAVVVALHSLRRARQSSAHPRLTTT